MCGSAIGTLYASTLAVIMESYSASFLRKIAPTENKYLD